MWRILQNREAKLEALVFLALSILLTGLGFALSWAAGVMVLLSVVCLGAILFWVELKKYREIEKLTGEVEKILTHGNAVLVEDFEEGDFSILKSQIRKMTVMLRESADHLRQEKVFLKDSLADISHQLRTPLTSINILLELLEEGDMTPEERFRRIGEMKQHMNRLQWLIESLLNIAKIDADSVNFRKGEVDLLSLVSGAISPLLVYADIKDILLDYKAFGGESLVGDEMWIREALTNIIKNCIEHTPVGGHVEIRARETAIFTELIIGDDGPGIESDDLAHLFERFYKGKGASDSSVGIGLALSKMIVSRQNGTIKVENRPEGGVDFIIKFYKDPLGGRTDGSIAGK